MIDSGDTRRRGLPRVSGGAPWPVSASGRANGASASMPVTVAVPDVPSAPDGPRPVRRGLPRGPGAAPAPLARTPSLSAAVAPSIPVAAGAALPATPVAPLVGPQTVFPGAAAARWRADRARGVVVTAPEPPRHGPFTAQQWVGASIAGGIGLVFAAGMLVLAVRWFVSLEFMREFVATYPGMYALPPGAPVGFPAWLGWQHFFNVFLMVLIIRSGLQVRHQQKPPAVWSPRSNPARKISLTLWFHQCLDILWLVNGAVFVVLLFASGQWVRIVPTSWDVFPNALTAALKYASLDWPTEHGWANYNSLQQLTYFATVFIAAPLAAITGVRMSGVWPKRAERLSRAYPVEWARAVHFPVMVFFVVFIVFHVALVFATGALRNLNHMYGGSDQVNGVGFAIFVSSVAVIAAGWVAARPMVLAPIARLFGTVSGR